MKNCAYLYRVMVVIFINYSSHSQSVQSWYSTDDSTANTQKLEAQPTINFESPDGATINSVTVNTSTTQQTFMGMGTSLDQTSVNNFYRMNAPTREAALRQLFDPNSPTGIRLNMVRIPFGTSDFTQTEFYTYDDVPYNQTDTDLSEFSIQKDIDNKVVAITKEILTYNPNLIIFGSVWSPPGWMKSNGSLIKGSFNATYTNVYAAYLRRTIQAYAAEGITIDALTPQNEPNWCNNSYPQACWSVQKLIDLNAALKIEFDNYNINTKIWVGDMDFSHANNYQEAIMNAAEAAGNSYVTGAGWHHYNGSSSVMSTFRNNHPGKINVVSEVHQRQKVGSYGRGIVNWFRAYANAAVHWVPFLDSEGCCVNPGNPFEFNLDRMLTAPSTNINNWTNERAYYVFGQFSRFVEPGALRVNSDDDRSELKTTAFVNPNNEVVLIVANDGTTTIPYKVLWNGKQFTTDLPAQSLGTYVWPSSGGGPPTTTVANLSPTDDTYIQGGTNANDVNGSLVKIEVKRGSVNDYFRKGLFKFDMAPENLTSADVTSAKLRLYVYDKEDNATFTLYKVSNDFWSEGTANWNNAPNQGASVGSTFVNGINQYFEWDVTSYVKEELDGDEKVSMILYDAIAANERIWIRSKEAGNNMPILSITTTSGGGSVDTTPPAPNPLVWSSTPSSSGPSAISMTASNATDASGIEYFFDCVSAGCNDSGWQDGITYVDTGLSPNTPYTYRVKARDKSTNQNETGYTSNQSATTDPLPMTENFEADEDTYAQGGINGNITHGNDSELQVKQGSVADYFRKAYFKFDLSSEGISGVDVSEAKLKLYINDKNDNASYTVYQFTDSWSEGTLTWNNAPNFGSAIGSTTVTGLGQYFEWDLTNYVQAQLNGSDDVVSVAIYDPNASNERIWIASSESITNRPLLEITHSSQQCLGCKTFNSQIRKEGTVINNILHSKDFRVYPNPVHDFINIFLPWEGQHQSLSLHIYDGKGAMVHTELLEGEKSEQLIRIDLSRNLKGNGIYLIKVQDGDKVYFQKIIKK